MAVSSRNSRHVLAGANDYRTVDLPGITSGEPTGDAWLGVFKSYDGGQTWTSVLLPGFPQDTSPQGASSVTKGYEAGADAYVRAGTNGMFYYSGLAFNRETNGKSAVFVARYIDNNNLEGRDTIQYVGSTLVASGDSTHFLDKPAIAVDIPRSGAQTCNIPAVSGTPGTPAQSFLGGRIYLAYTVFAGSDTSTQSSIMLTQSNDCGVTWTTPVKISGSQTTNQGAALAIDPNNGNLYAVWRVFSSKKDVNSIRGVSLDRTSGTLSAAVQVAAINPFDQGTTNLSFRTNAYPAITVDGASGIYVAWSQRAVSPSGDARIMLMAGKPSFTGTQLTGFQVSGPSIVDPYSGRGHQFMPAMAFSSGKLTLAWYDLRDDDQIEYYTALGGGQYSFALQPDGNPVFGTFIADPAQPYQPSSRRHTMDVRAAQAAPGLNPAFQPSVMVSQYAFGTPASSTSNVIQQLEMNAPNVPLFQRGSAPFIGDYIDIAGPTFVPSGSNWRFNTQASDPDHTSVVWTDNRNVVQPADGDWTHYTPVGIGLGQPSLFDPTTQAPACIAGQTGMRNQDIYTAALTPGVVMSAAGNAKPLSTAVQRAFAMTVQNPTTQSASYRLTLGAQPVGGVASFLQFPAPNSPPLTSLDIQIPPLSSASRSVFVTSSNPNAVISVNAVQITQPNGTITPGGLTSSLTLNSDISNPNISNPNISNTEIYTPNISNPNISNPNISNPNISNPNISNPNISNTTIANPNISNPNISNPNISNPNISNPNISNPNISNPNISNTALTDASYTVTNTGNTASAYTVQLLQNQPIPAGVTVQLIVSQVYTTPIAAACNLTVEAHYLPVVNITSPAFLTAPVFPAGTADPAAPTFSLLPGGTALVTLRVYDSTTGNPALALAHYNPTTAITPVVVSHSANTGTTTPPVTLFIATTTLQNATLGAAYSLLLNASGGVQPYTWSLVNGALPTGLQIGSDGLVTGVPASPGDFTFTAKVVDANGQTASRSVTLHVDYPPATQNFFYTYPLIPPGANGPYTWSAAPSAILPPGMTIGTDGTLSGKPTTTGYYAFSAIATANATPTTVAVTLQVISYPVIVSNLSLNQNGPAVTATAGSTLNVTFNYTIFESPSCPGCIDQIQLGFAGGQPQTCAYNGIPGIAPGVSGSASASLTVPAASGTYYLGINRSEQYFCQPFWAGGMPSSTFYIGTVTVP